MAKKQKSTKSKVDPESRLGLLPPTFPGNPDGKGLNQSQWEGCRAILEGVLVAKSGNRYMGDIFCVLPTKEELPEYYQAITEPECLDHICTQLEAQAYPTPEAFFSQLHLVFLNAKHFNEEGSQIYSDAEALEKQIHFAWKSNTAAGVFGTKAAAAPAKASTSASVAPPTPSPAPPTARPAPTPVPAPAPVPVPVSAPSPAPTPRQAMPSPAPIYNQPPMPTTTATGTPAKRPRGRPPKYLTTAAPTTPAAASPQHITLNFRAPSSHLGESSTPVTPPPPQPFAPPPRQASAYLPPSMGYPSASPSTSSMPLASPVQMPPRPVETGQPGINQFTTPAAIVPPVSPDQNEKLQRQRLAEADQSWINALEARLPKWQGPQQILAGNASTAGIPGSGWFGEGAPEVEMQLGGSSRYPQRIRAVLYAITEYRDTSGIRLSDALSQVSPAWDHPYISSHTPISLDTIRQSQYHSLTQFDLDMTRLFERARRYHTPGSLQYGHVLVLQRLYNALTAPYPMPLPPNGIPGPNPTLFASLPAGPGTARPLHEITQDLKAGVAETEVGFGITTFRVGTKDRIFTDEARHKGMAYKVGDYVHLINPDDASRPIIGQVFKTFVPTKGYRTHHVTVCWYYRPEQIVHTANRLFFENEIFKTSHFCDHPVEDIIERASCQFYVKAIRGRPQAPEYFPGWPLYICHSRYNDKGWFTVRIKNWASCIPDELRQTGFMDVIPFDRQIEPQLVKSPFLRGIRGPGFFAEAREGGEDEDDEDGPVKKRPAPEVATRRPGRPPGSVTGGGGAGGGGGGGTPPVQTPIPAQRYQPTTATPSTYQPQPQSYRQTPTQTPTQQGAARPAPQPPIQASAHARTIAGLMGGPQAVDQHALREYLAPDVARLFERDSRNQVLWFSGSPLVPGQIKVPTQPTHSVEYLEYLIKKRNGEATGPAGGEPRGKRYRTTRAPAATDIEAKAGEQVEVEDGADWWAEGKSEDEILEALKAVIESA